MANKKFYHNRPKQSRNYFDERKVEAANIYGEEKLGLTLEALGLSDAARELLTSNGVATAGALVIRTEKDMYKVQGLNKRVLLEVKGALKAVGMKLYEEKVDLPAQQNDSSSSDKNGKTPDKKGKQQAQNDKKQRPQKQDAQSKKEGEKPQPAKKADDKRSRADETRPSRFGLADRKDTSSKGQNGRPRAEKQERLTEPLPVEAWRKVMKGGKWGFSDGFKTVIPPMYDEVFFFKEGLACVEIDGKCGFIDSENNVVIPLDYDLAMSFSEGFAMVAKGEKCGYINKNNEVVIDFQFDAASPFESGEAKVKKDGKWATLSPNGDIAWI